MTRDSRPLVLLDVDGVINDLGALRGTHRPWVTERFDSHGYLIHCPDYMPGLVQELARLCEIHWCTTWRHRANDEISDHLGVEPFPVIDDASGQRDVSWKASTAYRLAAEALENGRRVIWIEDFAGDLPIGDMPEGVEFVDTAADCEFVLLPEHLPSGLTPEPVRASS